MSIYEHAAGGAYRRQYSRVSKQEGTFGVHSTFCTCFIKSSGGKWHIKDSIQMFVTSIAKCSNVCCSYWLQSLLQQLMSNKLYCLHLSTIR